jgi:hypothetical protein
MLPNLIIIGAAKAVTTSLHSYLAAHPDIYMSKKKELAHFLRDDWDTPAAIAEYEAHFAGANGHPWRGESTPMYTQAGFFPNAAERMAKVVPDARFIFVAREPFERLKSAYFQQRTWPRYRLWDQFVQEWRQPGDQLFSPMRYATQLKLYLEHFAPEQILVMDHDDLLHRQDDALREIFGWLGVDPEFRSPVFTEKRNTQRGKGSPRMPRGVWMKVVYPLTEKVPRRWREPLAAPAKKLLLKDFEDKPVITDELRAEMSEVLRPEMDWLREFSGKPFARWTV